MRILIAEDQKDLNKILMKKLTAEGYSVDTAFDGEEALDFIRMADYDGMILDINMPRKNGLEVVETIRKNGNYMPVLFLTARDSIEDKVTGYLYRPHKQSVGSTLFINVDISVYNDFHSIAQLKWCISDITCWKKTVDFTVLISNRKIYMSGGMIF